jgi:DNA polymerase III alpha subunit
MKKFHTFDCGCEIEIDQNLEPWNPYTPPLILDINHINENCPKTWELLKQGNTKGVFQLDGHLGKHWSKRLRPEDIEELAALISLLRPGCLTAEIKPGISMTEMYCLRKDKLEPIEYIHPSLENILKKTQGILTYQESSMHIVSQLAGFNLMEADKLRKAIGHKLAEEMAKVKGWFLEKAKTYGVVNEQEASDIFGWIEKSQRYSFNKSHAVSYASLSYLTAYCKAHFPVAFFCSYLTYAKKKQDTYGEVQKLVDNSRTMDIDVLPPDFRNLEPEFSTDGKLITFGLADIRGVGFDGVNKLKEIVPQVEQQIGKSRDNWTWLDFLINMTPNLDLTTVRGFIEVGALRYFKQPRALMAHEYLQVWRQLTPTAVKWITKNYQQYNSLLNALKDFVKLEGRKQGGANKPQREAIQSFINGMENPSTKLTDTPDRISAGEENSLGVAITCTKVDNYDISLVDTSCKELVNGKRADYIVMGVEVQNVKEVVTKKGKNPGQPMAFLTVRDSTCGCDDVMVPPKVWEEHNPLFTSGRTLLLRGGTEKKKGTFIVQKVWPLSLNS